MNNPRRRATLPASPGDSVSLTSAEAQASKLRLKSILLKLDADTSPDSDGGEKLTKKEVGALALEAIGAIGALIVDLVD